MAGIPWPRSSGTGSWALGKRAIRALAENPPSVRARMLAESSLESIIEQGHSGLGSDALLA